jgi:hypothetical protein
MLPTDDTMILINNTIIYDLWGHQIQLSQSSAPPPYTSPVAGAPTPLFGGGGK